MLIQCTKALLDKIGMKESELASTEGREQLPNSFMTWHANLVNIDRRKAIILMNNETRLPVVIYRPTQKDFSNIKNLMIEAITEALRMEGVRKEVIADYIAKEAGEISFSKTAGRSMVAKMNNAVRDVEFMREYLDKETKIQKYISLVTARVIQGAGEDDAFYPYEKMLECLSVVYGGEKNATVEEILDVNLYQLKIQLHLDGHDIWRRVVVPSTFSFRHLHYIIQTVFDWQNYHLHEFTVERGENKPIKILMDDEPDTLEYIDFEDFDILQERFTALEDIFPEHGEVMYEYDFGDSWEHIIILEKVVKSQTFQAVYLEGNGERPPEDVGGLWGFKEYLKIMEDKKNPSHHDMTVWAESQKERKLSSERINRRLKHIINGYGFSRFVI